MVVPLFAPTVKESGGGGNANHGSSDEGHGPASVVLYGNVLIERRMVRNIDDIQRTTASRSQSQRTDKTHNKILQARSP
jgi:hypothetical protein